MMKPVKMRKTNRDTWTNRNRHPLVNNKNLNKNIPFDKQISERCKFILQSTNFCRLPKEISLYDSICDYYNLDIKNVSIGFGATELLERLLRIYQDHTFYIHEPSYEMIGVMCKYMNIKTHSLDSLRYKYDIKGLGYFKDTKNILYIANPNGESGEINDLLPIFKNYKYVIVDEVYADFENTTCSLSADNVIVVKSFSKSLGLAGLRCGFAVANEEITRQLQEIRPVFVCNVASESIIPELIKETRHVNNRWKESRDYLEKEFEHKKSHGPYMLFKKPNYFTDKFGFKLTYDKHYRMALADMHTLLKNP